MQSTFSRSAAAFSPPLNSFGWQGAGSEVQNWLEELGLGRYFGLLQAGLVKSGGSLAGVAWIH